MISSLDDVLREFMKRELPIKKNEVNIEFDQPNREWSARLSRPTLNLFLHDVRENVKLRQRHLEWDLERGGNGQSVTKRRPVRVDLHYLVTAWANEPEDEHSLLSRALMALFRYDTIPQELLPEVLREQPDDLPIQVAQYETMDKPSDIWNVLDNNQRPGIFTVITLALNPYQEISGPIVRTRELRIGHRVPQLEKGALLEQPGTRTYWTIGGTLSGAKAVIDSLNLTLVELGRDVELQENGRFSIGNLQAGDYTLEIAAPDRDPVRHPIVVPAPDYEFQV